jgi:hypothetical protein
MIHLLSVFFLLRPGLVATAVLEEGAASTLWRAGDAQTLSNTGFSFRSGMTGEETKAILLDFYRNTNGWYWLNQSGWSTPESSFFVGGLG